MTNTISLTVSLSELCHKEGVQHDTIVEIVEYGIAEPIQNTELSEWTFDLETAYWIKKALQINSELHLDWVATSMIVSLIRQKEHLESENESLRQRLNRLL